MGILRANLTTSSGLAYIIRSLSSCIISELLRFLLMSSSIIFRCHISDTSRVSETCNCSGIVVLIRFDAFLVLGSLSSFLLSASLCCVLILDLSLEPIASVTQMVMSNQHQPLDELVYHHLFILAWTIGCNRGHFL